MLLQKVVCSDSAGLLSLKLLEVNGSKRATEARIASHRAQCPTAVQSVALHVLREWVFRLQRHTGCALLRNLFHQEMRDAVDPNRRVLAHLQTVIAIKNVMLP